MFWLIRFFTEERKKNDCDNQIPHVFCACDDDDDENISNTIIQWVNEKLLHFLQKSNQIKQHFHFLQNSGKKNRSKLVYHWAKKNGISIYSNSVSKLFFFMLNLTAFIQSVVSMCGIFFHKKIGFFSVYAKI